MLKSLVRKPVAFVATMPPSVTGMRASNLLKQRFQQLGGTILVSDSVVAGHLENHRVKYVVTNQLPDETLSPTISSWPQLNSQPRLEVDYEKVYEPVFG
jgi:glycerol-3-phosphate dehydrogenase subunit B